MNEPMRQLKQLNLTCYKMEVVMTVEAWYFLHGTTGGACNLFHFLSLLSKMTVSEARNTKRGLTYALHPGQADGSMLSLAGEWGIGRKAVCRLLEDFSERGLIRVVSNPVTTIIDMVCVKSWMKDGRVTENPAYRPAVKAYEGVRIFLFNGQRLETLRRSSARKKKGKPTEETAGETDVPATENPAGSGPIIKETETAKTITVATTGSGTGDAGEIPGMDADDAPLVENGDAFPGPHERERARE